MDFFLVSSFQMLVLLIGGCLSGAHQGLPTHPFEQVLADYLYERYSQQISFFREVQRNSELKQYIKDQQIQEQNISHTELEGKR